MIRMRKAIDTIGLLVAWLKRKRRLRPGGSLVKVNLGSALLVAPGWINLDASVNALLSGAPEFLLGLVHRWSGSRGLVSRAEYVRILRTNRFLHHNFQYGLPFDDDTVDYVYSSHLLEHLRQADALRLLREVHRVLKPGGWVRICVPDLAHALTLFHSGRKEDALEYFFSVNQTGTLNRHQYMYDEELMSSALRTSGFPEIHRREFRRGRVPDLLTLDNRPEETLYLEARKSATSLTDQYPTTSEC